MHLLMLVNLHFQVDFDRRQIVLKQIVLHYFDDKQLKLQLITKRTKFEEILSKRKMNGLTFPPPIPIPQLLSRSSSSV
jgi:hypothetical protein